MSAWLTGYSVVYRRLLRRLVIGLAFVAGVGIVGMMVTTCTDVVMRAFGKPLTGSYDMVSLLSVITIAGALPYTTAVKGHVAVEFFFHKLSRHGRIIVDTVIRVLIISLFAVLAVQSVKYGIRLREAGEVTLTLQIPIYWVPYVIAFSCAIVVLVVVDNLLHPGKAMIEP
jgi:TRAP-type C4-dicarboxylate transport system permease small subunit